MEQNINISDSYRKDRTVIFRRLPHSGGRGQRKEARARARAGSILCLCLSFERSGDALSAKSPTIDVAIVASKKQVSKEAVDRNRAKRRIRSAIQQLPKEAFAEILGRLQVVHAECIVVCGRDCLTTSFASLLKDLTKSLEKALSLACTARNQNVD